ncbi:MAG: DUF2207 domain-containing protein [Patescibacteria group bacterium]|jgi:hypothetical protein
MGSKLLSVLCGSLIWLSVAQAVQATDVITQYDVDLTVQPAGVVDVIETIQYDFGDLPGHGITRTIPTQYVNGLLNDTISVKLLDSNWPITDESTNQQVFWRIGNPLRTMTGLQTFIIHYQVDGVLTDYQKNNTHYVELYWNAIGGEWEVLINLASVTVHLPPDSDLPDYPAQCYFGPSGSTATCTYTKINDGYTAMVSQLQPYDYLTVLVAVNPTVVQMPSQSERYWRIFQNNWSVVFIPLIFLVTITLWWLNRSVKPSKPLIPIYDVPAGITSPYQAEYLTTGTITNKSIAAELIESARVGELEFVYDQTKKAVSTIRSLGKEGRTDSVITMLRQLVFSTKTEVELSKTTLYGAGFINLANHEAAALIKQQGWLSQTKQTIKVLLSAYSVVGFIGGGLLIGFGNEQQMRHLVITGIVLFVCGIVSFFFVMRRIPYNTAGRDVKQLLLGLKWFLSVTETERLKFSQVPKLTPTLFEKLLPYAIVFGVEQQWVKQFETILTEPPHWLHGANLMLLNSALLSASHTTNSFKAPASGRSGGGGFSSGGFSGGGFGGGGGGRW